MLAFISIMRRGVTIFGKLQNLNFHKNFRVLPEAIEIKLVRQAEMSRSGS
jgi:hypothetical protein